MFNLALGGGVGGGGGEGGAALSVEFSSFAHLGRAFAVVGAVVGEYLGLRPRLGLSVSQASRVRRRGRPSRACSFVGLRHSDRSCVTMVERRLVGVAAGRCNARIMSLL